MPIVYVLSTIAAFDDFRVKAESVTGRKIRRLRTDRAHESAAWSDYCRGHGTRIIHEFTAPSSAQNRAQNRLGFAESQLASSLLDPR